MPSAPALRHFGDCSFDAASGELKRGDVITRLQPQVAAVLEIFLERAGAVVTRAELQERLWPDTTVEFDDGLNFCIRQLRVALGDDANAPTYIETLPKRGYRFLPVVRVGDPDAAPLVAPEPRAHRIASPDSVHRRRWAGFALLVVL